METMNHDRVYMCTLEAYKQAYDNLPETHGGILKRMHNFDASRPCPPLTDVPKSRKGAMDFGLAVAGHRLNQVFDIQRSYDETFGDVSRLAAIVENLLWVYFRKTEWPEPQRWQRGGAAFPESTKYYYKNSHSVAARQKAIRDAEAQRVAAQKRRAKEEEQLAILGQVALQERGFSSGEIARFTLEEIRAAGMGKFNDQMERQQTVKKSQGASKASDAVQMEFLEFLKSDRYRESYTMVQPEHPAVKKTSGLGFAPSQTTLIRKKFYLHTLRDFSELLSRVGQRCGIEVDFAPGPQFVCFTQNRFYDFGKLPLEGGKRSSNKSGKLYAYTLADGPFGLLLGVDRPSGFNKTFEKKFAGFTNPNPNFPAAGAKRVNSTAHLLYELGSESLTATFTTQKGYRVSVQVDKGRPANSVDAIVLELFPAPCVSRPAQVRTAPVTRPQSVDLDSEMQRLSLAKEVKRQEAKLEAMKREQALCALVKKEKKEQAKKEQAKKEQAKPSDGIVEQLEKLLQMKNNGMLSQAQFESAKARLLA